ncbi:Uncharacterised protein [Bordetella pertussis]|nr:Uncharacterised protein [Bordetella pertussis]
MSRAAQVSSSRAACSSTSCWSGPSTLASKRSARSCARAQACDHSMAVSGPLRLASNTASCMLA